ncbi:MAG: hypothetical protein ABL952_02250 [Pyrinomonadaceae bacterium]
MPRERVYFLLIGLLLLLCVNSIAQRSDLVITGSVISAKPAGPLIKPPALKNGLPVRQETYFEVQLRLQFYNRGDVPLIVPTPRFFYGGKRMQFFEIPSSDSRLVASSDEWGHSGGKELTKSLMKLMEHTEPPGYYFTIIDPGSTYEITDLVRVKSGYKVETLPNSDKRGRDLEIAIPEHSYFKVRYSLFLKDKTATSNNPADAQRRWKRFGKLLLNADGEFFLETEIIINKLPD